MKDFFANYWREILLGVEALFSVVFFIIKKRPKMNMGDSIKNIINDCLVDYIRLAEASFTSGTDKLYFVAGQVLNKIKHYYSSVDEHYWTSYIIDKIESVLSCPQKKEKKNNEKD